MENLRSRAGGIAVIVLALFLLFYCLTGLLGLAIPAWVGYSLAGLAGLLLLVGR